MIKNTLIIACLIGSSGAGGLLLSEAHGHVLNATVLENAISSSRNSPQHTVLKLETASVAPAVTPKTQTPDLVVAELAPRQSARPAPRTAEANLRAEDVAPKQVAPAAATGSVVKVTVTKRFSDAKKKQRVRERQSAPVTEAVTQQESLMNAAPHRPRGNRLMQRIRDRLDGDRFHRRAEEKPEILHGVYR